MVMTEFYNKLMAIQQDLNAPKNQRNDFGKYNYRSCEDILQAVKPLLQATKTVLTLSDSMGEVGGRVYVKATATLRDVESGDSVSVEAYAREEETKKGMDASQITGAASSYARKYALNGLFAIDDNKDSDATNTGDRKPEPKPRRQAPPPDVMPGPQESEDGYYYCKDCGQIISGVRVQGGKQLSPREVIQIGMDNFGEQLCYSCGAARMKNR